MSDLLLRYLAYFGPNKPPAEIYLEPGLNVICGASETGKSLIVESIDFMLGQENAVREIPERSGYDRIRLLVESTDWPPLALDRSVEGGHFRAYEESLTEGPPRTEAKTLRWQHSAARQDTLSYSLLQRLGLTSKILRRNAQGDTRSLSFRDLVRLTVVTEEEIQSRRSPFLTGQYTTATPEYAVLKILLTGTDDSALVSSREIRGRRDAEDGKIELLDQMIQELQITLDEQGVDEDDLSEQVDKLEDSIKQQNAALSNVQRALNTLIDRRGAAAKEIRNRRARLVEIEELAGRFRLLDNHYETDIRRLEAIHESGSIFASLDSKPCPLCGAQIGDQHLDADCDGNTEAVVRAASAEIAKINRLRRELHETIGSLEREGDEISRALPDFEREYKANDQELSQIAAPAVSEERTSYDLLISERAEVRAALEKFDRLHRLVRQRGELEPEDADASAGSGATRTQISKSVLDEFSQTVEQILNEWHFPNAERVFFDESRRDFQIYGKERGSTGKGLRAITHAAVTIGLMVFCREHGLPHPGFVVLDSPLLAYWKPEGAEDDLRGTDLKDRFYEYLLGLQATNQVIIIENEHPPDFVSKRGNVVVFTKNPHQGRYGFFPHRD
jgi:septal ring factor EnvC (AmiA/AmiB activator)